MKLTKETVKHQNKIAELLRLQEKDAPVGWDNFSEHMKKQEKLMDELTEFARKHKTLIGRTMKFQVADSYALYLITHVNKSSVQVAWIDWCDGWTDEMIEAYGRTIPLAFAKQKVYREDALAKLFSK